MVLNCHTLTDEAFVIISEKSTWLWQNQIAIEQETTY